MKKVIALVVLSVAAAHAQVYAYFTKDPTLMPAYSDYTSYVMPQASVGGITVDINWADFDTGNNTFGPILGSLTSLEAHLNATIRSGQKINLVVLAASGHIGAAGMNVATPSYVFDPMWASSCCGTTGPVDVCYCNNYQGSGSDGWSWTKSNCYNQNNYPTGMGHSFDSEGVPAAWEQPFYTAYTKWLGQFLPQIASDLGTKLGYIRIGVGTGGGSVIPCPNVEADAFTGPPVQSSGPAIPLNSLTVWHNYNNAVYSAAHTFASGTTLEASMYGGEMLPNGDGTTPLSWADDVASTAIANDLGIGAESLAFSDLPLYASDAPCSNDWCQLFNQYSLSSPMLGLQTVSLSDPTCITNPACGNATGSLVTVLPFGTQRHARVFELGYQDLLCAYDSSSSGSSCASGAGSAYPSAIQNAAFGFPSSTAALSGGASLSSKATLN